MDGRATASPPKQNLLLQLREKFPDLREPATRDFIRNYLPPLAIVVCLTILIIFCATFKSSLNSCFNAQVRSHEEDVLLNSNQINIIIRVDEKDIYGDLTSPVTWDRQKAIVRFIYTKYGRFIRTQIHHKIDFNSTVKMRSSHYIDEFLAQLNAMADKPIGLAYHGVRMTEPASLMNAIEESLAFHLVRGEKRLTVHAVNEAFMEDLNREYFFNVTFGATNALMVLLDTTISATNVAVLSGVAHKPFEELFVK